MKKALALSVTLLATLTLAACSHSGQSSAHLGSNKDRSSKVTKTSSKASTSSTSESSSSTSVSDQLATQLSDDDWFVLAYMKEWGAKTPDHIAMFPKDQLEFYSWKGQTQLEQGTTDSSCHLISVTQTSVTVAPSSGEGASSTYSNVTLSKADLIKEFIPSQKFITDLKTATAIAEQRGKETQARVAQAEQDSSSSQSDSNSDTDSNGSDDNDSSVDSNNDDQDNDY